MGGAEPGEFVLLSDAPGAVSGLAVEGTASPHGYRVTGQPDPAATRQHAVHVSAAAARGRRGADPRPARGRRGTHHIQAQGYPSLSAAEKQTRGGSRFEFFWKPALLFGVCDFEPRTNSWP